VIVYGLVSAETEQAVELFLRPEDAERMLAEALSDEPDWIETLSVEPVELPFSSK
jgi:uncharacterized Fe-S cluster-containing radical SAM superfamily protein